MIFYFAYLRGLTRFIVVDMSPDGTTYGVELLNANEQIKGHEHGKLLIVNEATGAINEMPIHTDLE